MKYKVTTEFECGSRRRAQGMMLALLAALSGQPDVTVTRQRVWEDDDLVSDTDRVKEGA